MKNNKFIIKNAQVVNDNTVIQSDIRVCANRISQIGNLTCQPNEQVIDIEGRWLMPGVIDDQVHFREPGLTHKADIYHESRAAVAGGVTSFMEMPNVKPPSLTLAEIKNKRAIADKNSVANYAFYLGASATNLEDIKAIDPNFIAGVKIFMGSSTGNLLVEDDQILEAIFTHAPTIIATHCEDDQRIEQRFIKAQAQFGDAIPPAMHSVIRDHQACYNSSQKAVALAKQTNARLHILHITTAQELALFSSGTHPNKRITAEACIHHLLFNETDYPQLGNLIKCNPSVKTAADQIAIKQALLDSTIDVLATDHAPHLLGEKNQPYAQSPSGLPTIEYALPAHLQLLRYPDWTMPRIAHLTAHRVADLFEVQDRGYLREGYYADFVVVEKCPTGESGVRDSVLSKCNWTPFKNYAFDYRVHSTYVNGNLVWQNGTLQPAPNGMALEFTR